MGIGPRLEVRGGRIGEGESPIGEIAVRTPYQESPSHRTERSHDQKPKADRRATARRPEPLSGSPRAKVPSVAGAPYGVP